MKAIKITAENGFRNADVDSYLNDIRKYKPLSVEEEIECAIAIHNGDKRAETKLINANLSFVVSIAKRYQGMGLDILDLISEGNVGLIKAAREFDETQGFKFISFAVAYIRQEMLNALCDLSRTVRVPQHIWKEGFNTTSISMETKVHGDDEDKTLLDTFASDSRTDIYDHLHDVNFKVNSLLSTLKQRDREIICALFGIGQIEQHESTIATRYGLTEERVRQIKWEVIEKLRNVA